MVTLIEDEWLLPCRFPFGRIGFILKGLYEVAVTNKTNQKKEGEGGGAQGGRGEGGGVGDE